MTKIFVWCLLLFTEIYAYLDVGDSCGAKSIGVCLPVDTCSVSKGMPAYHNLERCGFLGHTELVCCMEPPRKSEAACMEYGEEIDEVPFINAFNASLGEFPHMAVLGAYEDPKTGPSGKIVWGYCGGSLISENYVLTAANCILRNKPDMVRLGKVDLFGNSDNVKPQDLPVAGTITHTDYQYLNNKNDIALVRLTKPARFTKYVSPICLYTEPKIPTGSIIVAGWPVTTANNLNSFLLRFTASLVDFKQCNETLLIQDSQLCAVAQQPIPTAICHVSSGSPIHTQNTKDNLYGTPLSLVGVSSFGIGCESTSIPSVYTRVNNYLEWIESIVWS